MFPVLLCIGALASRAWGAGVTDLRSKKPPAITLPAAGGKYIDPIFGTTIIRVTDANDGVRCVHAYSYWPAFNLDGSRLMVACDDNILLYKFDRSTDKLTRDGKLQGSDGYKVQFDGASWSQTSATTVYAVDQSGTRLWKINIGTRGKAGYSLLKDFSATTGGLTIHQLTVSSSGTVFSFHTRTSAGDHKDAYVYDRTAGKIYKFSRPSGFYLDESKIDKGGLKAMINAEDGRMILWDFRAGKSTTFDPDNAADNVSGHFDIGGDFIANSDGWNTGLAIRTLSSPGNVDNIVQYKRSNGSLNWTLCDHVSLREDDELWAVGSTYCGDGTYSPFEREIFMARTDGGGFVRLAHSRSLEANSNSDLRYYAQPRAVIDNSGRYIVYTSDLGSSSRFDVMIVKVPSAYWP